MMIRIADEFTKIPGGRHISDGPHSGEEFREKMLKPAFYDAKMKKEKLVVDLDGGFGYGTSFLDEAFGGLARVTKDPEVLNIQIISTEEPTLVERVMSFMKSGLGR